VENSGPKAKKKGVFAVVQKDESQRRKGQDRGKAGKTVTGEKKLDAQIRKKKRSPIRKNPTKNKKEKIFKYSGEGGGLPPIREKGS